jgi:hypothetical protein
VRRSRTERNALLGGAAVQPERLALTAHQLDALVGSHPTEGARRTTEQAKTRVTRQISRFVEVQETLVEQLVDVRRGDVQLSHARPSGGHDVVSVVLVGR